MVRAQHKMVRARAHVEFSNVASTLLTLRYLFRRQKARAVPAMSRPMGSGLRAQLQRINALNLEVSLPTPESESKEKSIERERCQRESLLEFARGPLMKRKDRERIFKETVGMTVEDHKEFNTTRRARLLESCNAAKALQSAAAQLESLEKWGARLTELVWIKSDVKATLHATVFTPPAPELCKVLQEEENAQAALAAELDAKWHDAANDPGEDHVAFDDHPALELYKVPQEEDNSQAVLADAASWQLDGDWTVVN